MSSRGDPLISAPSSVVAAIQESTIIEPIVKALDRIIQDTSAWPGSPRERSPPGNSRQRSIHTLSSRALENTVPRSEGHPPREPDNCGDFSSGKEAGTAGAAVSHRPRQSDEKQMIEEPEGPRSDLAVKETSLESDAGNTRTPDGSNGSERPDAPSSERRLAPRRKFSVFDRSFDIVALKSPSEGDRRTVEARSTASDARAALERGRSAGSECNFRTYRTFVDTSGSSSGSSPARLDSLPFDDFALLDRTSRPKVVLAPTRLKLADANAPRRAENEPREPVVESDARTVAKVATEVTGDKEIRVGNSDIELKSDRKCDPKSDLKSDPKSGPKSDPKSGSKGEPSQTSSSACHNATDREAGARHESRDRLSPVKLKFPDVEDGDGAQQQPNARSSDEDSQAASQTIASSVEGAPRGELAVDSNESSSLEISSRSPSTTKNFETAGGETRRSSTEIDPRSPSFTEATSLKLLDDVDDEEEKERPSGANIKEERFADSLEESIGTHHSPVPRSVVAFNGERWLAQGKHYRDANFNSPEDRSSRSAVSQQSRAYSDRSAKLDSSRGDIDNFAATCSRVDLPTVDSNTFVKRTHGELRMPRNPLFSTFVVRGQETPADRTTRCASREQRSDRSPEILSETYDPSALSTPLGCSTPSGSTPADVRPGGQRARDNRGIHGERTRRSVVLEMPSREDSSIGSDADHERTVGSADNEPARRFSPPATPARSHGFAEAEEADDKCNGAVAIFRNDKRKVPVKRSFSEGDSNWNGRTKCHCRKSGENPQDSCGAQHIRPVAFPSLSEVRLEESGIANLSDVDWDRNENLSEAELAGKVTAFSIGLSVDRITLKRRMALSVRQRDQSERNLACEVQKMQQDIQDLSPLCTDRESIERVERVRHQLDTITRCAHKVSCASETLGAMHQEGRVSKAVLLVDRYLQVLRAHCEKLSADVAETKRILLENNIVIEEHPGELGDNLPRIRYTCRSGMPSNNRTMIARRRASIATISRPLSSAQDVTKEGLRQRNSVSGRVTLRRPSLSYEPQKWETEKLNRTDSSSTSIGELRDICEHAESRRQSREENNNVLRNGQSQITSVANYSTVEDESWTTAKLETFAEAVEVQGAPDEPKSSLNMSRYMKISNGPLPWRSLLWCILIFFLGFYVKHVISSADTCTGARLKWWSIEEILSQYVHVRNTAARPL